MILDSIITFIYDVVVTFFTPLDYLNNIVIDPYIMDSVYDFFGFVAYLIPLRRLWPIVAIYAAIHIWRISITLLKTLWDALPIV